MKFLFLTDTHLRSTNPVSRVGSFENDILSKLDFCVEEAVRRDCDFIIHGGDLFDRPNVGVNTLLRTAQIIKSWPKKWIQVIGNHDIFGSSFNTLDNTYIGVLRYLLTNFCIEDEENDVVISLNHYKLEKEENFSLNIFDKPTVHVVHQMIVEKPFFGKHTLASELYVDSRECNLVLCGHYHPSFSFVPSSKFQVYNPGALCRLTSSKADRSSKPSALFVVYDKNSEEFIVEKVSVPHRPEEEAFNLKQADNVERDRETIFRLADISGTLAHNFTLESLLYGFKDQEGIRPEVISEIEKRVNIL